MLPWCGHLQTDTYFKYTAVYEIMLVVTQGSTQLATL